MNEQSAWDRWWSRVSIQGVITGAVPALLLGAWAWHKFIGG